MPDSAPHMLSHPEQRKPPARHDHGHSHLGVGAHAAATAEGLRAVTLATLGMLAVAAFQLLIFALSNSAGLLSDALHNLGDILTTVALGGAFLVARRPATRRYTYGFSRAEDLAGAFIAIVIVASAGAAAYESVAHLLAHTVPTRIGWAILAALIGFVGNEGLAEYKMRVGRRIGSQALIADGQHSRTDGLTSLAAAIGLALTFVGLPMADPIAGLLISVAILYILVDVGRGVYWRLMDAVDPQVVEAITALAAGMPGVAQVTETRARWAGRQLYIALVLTADPSLTLAAAHAIAERVRQEVLHHVPGASMVDVHVDPAGLEAEAHAPLPLGHNVGRDPGGLHSQGDTHEHDEPDEPGEHTQEEGEHGH